MRAGLHLSISEGLFSTLSLALETTCDVIQIFSGAPRNWRTAAWNRTDTQWFSWALNEKRLRPLFIHLPYLVNMAAPDPEIRRRSLTVLKDAVRKAGALGGGFLVVHAGSHGGDGFEAGLTRIGRLLQEALQRAPSGVGVLLEGGAGGGNGMAGRFPQLAEMMAGLGIPRDRLGLCLDTAHLYAAGYDLASPTGVEEAMDELSHAVGRDRIRLIHANDTDAPLFSRRDHHVNPPSGLLGERGFRSLLSHPALAGIPIISEADYGSPAEGKAVLDGLRHLVA
ncbi:MAG: deoxyribonuclease IV [Anaerolineae bacterium]